MDSQVRGLQEVIAGLENAIGSSSFKTIGGIPNPQSSISAKGEVAGGTFTTSGGIHDALGGELSAINGALDSFGSLEIGGGAEGGSLESSNIKRAGKVIESMNNSLSQIKNSVNERMDNIVTLQNVLNTSFENLLKIVKSSDDEVGVADAKNIKFVQEKVADHLEKEMNELQKILKVHIKPSKESLQDLLKKNKSFSALADALGTSYNTDQASDRLAIAFTNLSNVGAAAQRIKESLKVLNLTINDYEKITNIKKLGDSLSKTLKSASSKKEASAKLSKILDAMKILQDNQYRHNDVIACLKDENKCTKMGKGEESSGGSIYDSIGGVEGADDVGGSAQSETSIGRVRRSNRKSSLTTSIKTYQNTLKELFKNFMAQIQTNFKEVKTAVEEVADQIGSEIPYDEKIQNFVNVFEGLNSDMDNNKLFYALIELDKSLQSKELKSRFVDNLNKLISSLSDLKSHKYLNEIEKQLVLVKENIDTYSDTVTGVKDSDFKLKEGSSSDVTGSNDFFWTNKILDQSVPLNVAALIKEIITKLKFYGNVSKLRSNLESTFKEYSGYKEDYDKLLGKSIGTKINELTKEYTENVDRLSDKERGRGWLLDEYNKSAPADKKVPRGLIETIYKLQFDAKVGLYKTIEAIDLYLMNFTEQLSGNVEAVKDLNKMLQQTEIISKWFNNDSEKHLTELKNMIKNDATVPGDTKPFLSGPEIKKVLETCKKSIDSVSMLKNIISMFVHIGDKFGNKTLSKDMYMSPNIMYKNLVKYTWVSAFTMGYGTAGGNVNAAIDGLKKDKNGYEVEKGDIESFFNLKYIQLKSPLDLLRKYEQCMLDKFGIKSGKGINGGARLSARDQLVAMRLKRLINAADEKVKILKEQKTRENINRLKSLPTDGSDYYTARGYPEPPSSTYPGPGGELKDAVVYGELKDISAEVGRLLSSDAISAIESNIDELKTLESAKIIATMGNYKGIEAVLKDYTPEIGELKDSYFPDGSPTYPLKELTTPDVEYEYKKHTMSDKYSHGGPDDDLKITRGKTFVDGLINKHIFVNDDRYFILMLKAITSKVLTVVGTSNIIKRPSSVASMLSNPIRTIIGGGKDPEIIDEAFELYIRLPLLVEFYKNVFENGNEPYKRNKRSHIETETIAYIPEIGSIWSGLIQCVFDESRYIKDGLYSLDNMKRIILEVNNIYKSYKNVDKKKLVRTAVLDLIADVNKRYGVLKQEEINEFYQIKKKYIRNINDINNVNNVNFDILDENNEYESSGPSSQYVENVFSKSSINSYNIVSNDINIVKDFHDNINRELFENKNVDIQELSKKSFVEKIKFYKNELSQTNSNSSKLELIIKAIDESSNINSHNDDVKIMFHELVAAPIKNLQVVRSIIYSFVSQNIPIMQNSIVTGNILKDEYKDIINAIRTQTASTVVGSSYKKAVDALLVNGSPNTFNKITLLETIINFFNDSNNLIDIKFISNNKFILDTSKLRKNVETSIENVKYMISKFRSQMSKNTIEKYEQCLLDIEDKLLLKILNNDENNDMAFFDICNFDYINNCITEVLDSTKSTLLGLDLYNSIMFKSTANIGFENKRLSSKKLNSALFKDVFAQYQGGNKRLWVTLDQLSNAGAMQNTISNDFTHLGSIYTTLDDMKGKSRSLLSGFNTLVYQYLSVFYDSSSKKIYNNLFNEFVNKSQSNAIFNNTGIPDIISDLSSDGNAVTGAAAVPAGAYGINTFIQNDHVLCESLAYMFKTIVNRTSNIQLPTKNHLLLNLSEVSPNIVEKYKVYLPIFIKLFETLINKSLLFKKVLETTSNLNTINQGNAPDGTVAGFTTPRYIHGDVKGDVQKLNGMWLSGTGQSYNHFNNTLNNIIEASRSLINDATVVLSEINHKQQFFEIKENFIKNFYNNTNRLPLMPLSLTTLLLNKNVFKNKWSLMPHVNKPDNEIKFLYGINSVINNKALDNNINSYIWLKEELMKYNSGSLSTNKIDVGKINEYLEVNNKFSVTLASLLYNNDFITLDNAIKENTLTNASECNIETYYTTIDSSPFVRAISSVDSTSVDNNKRLLANVIDSPSITAFNINRSRARFLNILDLNVMPINIHALMREIPLINIYNYAFTYDSIVKQTMGSKFDVDDCKAVPVGSTEIITALLLDPYYINRKLPKSAVYGAIISDNDILGKGKYMSDTIIKALTEGQNNMDLIDSKFIRNLIFFTNLQRFITYKIKKEVEHINTKVVSDIAIINPKITTYGKENKAYDDKEFDYLMI